VCKPKASTDKTLLENLMHDGGSSGCPQERLGRPKQEDSFDFFVKCAGESKNGQVKAPKEKTAFETGGMVNEKKGMGEVAEKTLACRGRGNGKGKISTIGKYSNSMDGETQKNPHAVLREKKGTRLGAPVCHNREPGEKKKRFKCETGSSKGRFRSFYSKERTEGGGEKSKRL